MKKKVKILWAVIILTFLIAIGCLVYISDCYSADITAMKAMNSAERYTVEAKGNTIVFSPALPKAGLIFYPGGKVEYTAYAPLMASLAEEGILCVLVKMPGNLAVLDRNAADGIPEQYPNVEAWYIGGHSLGGSMAASYVSDHTTQYDGLVLLAAYSTADLSDSGLEVLSIYGSEDGVLNREKYNKSLPNLPENSYELILQGGNHAYFGSYGSQDGDGAAAITAEEQIEMTVQYMTDFILN